MNIPFRPALSRIGVVSVLSIASVLFGLAPQATPRPSALVGVSAAYAQASDPTVVSYANAAYQIERLRQKKFSEAKQQFQGADVPANVCQQQSIPASVRSICDDFLKESADIIKSNGMSISQFNDYTRRKKTDPALQQQIDSALLQIQKGAQ